MPTGVPVHDARGQLFDAAERVLLRAGPSGLTSRAVTVEAGCAKGVLHRHFPDFDDFLAEFVLDRVATLATRAAVLGQPALGHAGVIDRLTDGLTAVFCPVAVAIIPLVTFRDELRARLRQARPVGVPILTEAAELVRSCLATERDLGRISADADLDTLAPTLIGAAHLLFADRTVAPPSREAVRRMVATVLAGALPVEAVK